MSNDNITLSDLANRKTQEAVENFSQEKELQAIQEKTEMLTPEQRKRVDEIKDGIDIMNSQEAVLFGSGTQRSISEFSDNILNEIRNKDTGYVGELMSDLMIKVKDLQVDKIGERGNKIPFFSNLSNSIKRFKQRYQTMEVQIDKIQAELENAQIQMLKDISMFDKLYEKNLEYFRELEIYILAGEEKIEQLRTETLPKLREEAAQSNDPMSAQLVNDFEDTVNRFEKKVHDLKISKTIAIQTAPQIKLIQNNDKVLVDKIQTAILNTIPLWKSQIVIAIGLQRQQNALKMQREVSDATNELLKKNSEMLKQNTIETAKEAERSIVDLETLKIVNANLISTIEETIKIQKDGRAARKNAEAELVAIENQLKEKLISIRNKN